MLIKEYEVLLKNPILDIKTPNYGTIPPNEGDI